MAAATSPRFCRAMSFEADEAALCEAKVILWP
jgi:hypothetical protein